MIHRDALDRDSALILAVASGRVLAAKGPKRSGAKTLLFDRQLAVDSRLAESVPRTKSDVRPWLLPIAAPRLARAV